MSRVRDAELVETPRRSVLRYRGMLLHLYEDTVRLPNGRTAVREIIRHPGAVAVVPLSAKGIVTLVEQYRHALRRVTLEIPAGKLDQGETPLACARRELAEETGLQARSFRRLASLWTTPGFTDEVIHIYLATGLTARPAQPDDDEFVRVVRKPLIRALGDVRLGRIADSKSVAGLLLAAQVVRGR